jgi:CheY-like chemotaxis protein
VIQESLTNVVRHSESKRAWVQCAANFRQLKIVIQDEGIGLDAKRIGAGQKAGVGIQSMTDRMKLLGGSLEIHSSKHGTRVTAAVPLSKARATGEAGEGPETEKIELLPRGVAHTDGRKRILIADDHVVARQGIKSLLGDQPDLEICGEAENGADAVAKARQLVPDLLILDLNMPHMGGISAADQIRKIGLEMKILIYTTHSYPGLDRMARNSGCNGFVLKSNASNDLIRGVRAVLANSEFYVGGAPQPRVKSARSQG